MSDITEKIEHLKQILPKYEIIPTNTPYFVNIKCTNYKLNLKSLNDNLIQILKFIYDNYDYFVEMLLLNDFSNTNLSDIFKRGNLYITICPSMIFVDNDIDSIYINLNNIETMYDDLRKIIEIDVSYKHVTNE